MDFHPIIGLEIHLQLNSRAKLFCRAPNFYSDNPNTNVDFYTFALPGSLPVINPEAVEKAVLLALGLCCQIQFESYFDRKHYFYPDLPKGYQITQFFKPFAVLGKFVFPMNGRLREVPIKSIQLEEDAGKNLHDRILGLSLVDLNRAGVPLVEVITDPCFRSPEEAAEFVRYFRNFARYLGISEANLEQGSLRCDVNVSVKKTDSVELGTRVEIKNLNSFKFLVQALNYEIGRQVKLVREGREVKRETRGYNPEKNVTYSLRSKEELSDYRYMPDPDLPPLVITDSMIKKIASKVPRLPNELFLELTEINHVNPDDAALVSYDKEYAELYLKMLKGGIAPKVAVNYIVNDLRGHLNTRNLSIDQIPFNISKLQQLLMAYQNNEISSKGVKTILEKLFDQPALNIDEELAGTEYRIVDDASKAQQIVDEVLAENANLVSEILAQESKSSVFVQKRIGFLVGQAIKRAPHLDPKQLGALIRSKFGLD
ncbi:MAG: Asp-tRNA(Asn)/Glu-tRNA(Gln) amidotransferase subunit GatB [Deltaproteobacteria bacterium]|nr:Asp-tRNA(Asn)/Glu-tRNA(Gln) amidotransferase subunit GatB [Deltaproteobacteria bacterium]